MTSAVVVDAIRARVQSANPALDVVHFEHVDDIINARSAAFVALEPEAAAERELGIGPRPKIGEAGRMAVHLFWPAAEPLQAGRVVRDALRDVLRGVRLDVADGTLDLLDASPDESDPTQDRRWYVMTIALSYSAELRR